MRAVIDARWKLIASTGRTGEDMLFDLLNKFEEKHNLAISESTDLEPKKTLLAAYESGARQTAPETTQIDRKTVEKLRGLGYMGGGG